MELLNMLNVFKVLNFQRTYCVKKGIFLPRGTASQKDFCGMLIY